MALTRIKVDNLSTAVLNKIRELSIDSSAALNLFSVNDNGGDGSLTYNSSTGVIEYTGPSATEVRSHFAAGGDLTYDSATGRFSVVVYTSADFDSDLYHTNTTFLAEGSNLYYTTARADSAFDDRLATKTTDDLTEGTNLYHTSGRVNTLIDTRVTKTFVDNLNVDADTLDGLNSTQFLRSDSDTRLSADLTVDSNLTIGGILYGPSTFYIDPIPINDNGGKVVIKGDLQVDGTTTTVNSTTVSINDKNLVLADSAADSAEADGAGLTIGGASATFTYSSSNDGFITNKDLFVNTNRVLTTADEGSGNGLDADTVDGQEYADIISEATALAIALG